jgi:cysteine desulfurase
VFTSGGTESDNLALTGVAWSSSAQGRQIIVSAIEHKAVLQSCAMLERHGFEITILPVDGEGRVDPDDLDALITDRTILVSVMAASNEVGTIEPIIEIGNVCRAHRVSLHVDAVQAAPFMRIDVNSWQVDLLSLSAHKLYGPKGIGALFIRQGTPLVPLHQGGSQERQRRAGTENVAAAAGFAAAFALAADGPSQAAESEREAALRDELVRGLLGIHGVQRTGADDRLPNSVSVVISGIEGGDLVAALDLEGIEGSTGSACTTGSVEPSHVLLAMGIDPLLAHGSLRLTLGRGTRDEHIPPVIEAVANSVERLRSIADQPVEAGTLSGASSV